MVASPSRIISIQDHTSMSNVVEEPHIAYSLSSRASGTEHPSSPTPNVRKKGRKYGSDLTDSAKKRKRQEHNKKGNARKKKEKHASRANIAELEGRIASLSGLATEKIVMSSKVEAAEAATKIAQQKQSEAEELSTEKGFHQALCRERQKLEDKEMQWLKERAELKRQIIEVRQLSEAQSRSTRDIARELSDVKDSNEKLANKCASSNRLVTSLFVFSLSVIRVQSCRYCYC